jgi:PAS domain S-box-containing protein
MLPAAVLLPLAILGMGGFVTWRSTWDEARSEVTRTADAAAEHARSLLEQHRLRATMTQELLRGLSEEDIQAREPELQARLRKLVGLGPEPGPFTLYAFSRDGRISLNTDFLPSPPGNYADRDYFRAMRDAPGPALRVGEVTLGRANQRLFFPVTLRRDGGPDGREFEGAINVSVTPHSIAEGMSRLRGNVTDVVSLVRQDGAILSRTLPLDRPLPWRQAPDARVRGLMAQELERFESLGPSAVDGVARLVAYRRLEGWPIYAAVARDRQVIVARWHERAALLLAIGLPATLALAVLALLVGRAQQRAEAAQTDLEWRVRQRTEELATSEGRLRLAIEAADLGTWEVDFRTGRAMRSARTLAIFGAGPDEADGIFPSWRERVHPEDRDAVAAAFAEVRSGERDRYALVYRFQRPDGAWIWVESAARVVERDEGGQALRLAGTVQDVTARREAEERRALLAREVDHRAKNALAVVQAALRLTPRTDVASYATAVEGRVNALARAHTLLASQRWSGAELRQLLEGELATFLPEDPAAGQPRAQLEGPAMQVAASAAQSLSLVFHELATNAVKHGALSAAAGRLRVRWEVQEDGGRLLLEWLERGGPAPQPSSRRGFGSRLVAAVVRDQLGGALDQEWPPEGLTVTMRIPLPRVRAGERATQEAEPSF